MSFVIVCPKCGVRLKAKNDAAVGKKLPCPKCEQVFVVQKPVHQGSAQGADTPRTVQPAALPPRPTESTVPTGTAATSAQEEKGTLGRGTILAIAGGAGVVVVSVVFLLWTMFSDDEAEPLAVGESSVAGATTTDQTDSLDVGGSEVEQDDTALIAELHEAVAEMLKEADASLSPEEISSLADARMESGLEAVRRFYPEFLMGASPGNPELAKERIMLVHKENFRLGTMLPASDARRQIPFSAIVQWLSKKYAAGELDPNRTELLAQLMLGHFRRVTALFGSLNPIDRDNVVAWERTLFPGRTTSRFLESRERPPEIEQMKQIVQAMHTFHDVYRVFPGPDQARIGEPKGLSWRVHILKFLSQESLYNEFQLDEPWDSPNNRALVARMPEVYKTPGVTQPGMTGIQVFVGAHTPFGGEKPPRIMDIRDGTANTVGIVMTGPEKAVEWTRPGGIEFEPEAGLRMLGSTRFDEGYLVAFLDCSWSFLKTDTSAELFSRLVMHEEGEPVAKDTLSAERDLEVEPLWPFGNREKLGIPSEQLKSIGLAMHNYHDRFKAFPSASANAAGQTGLSWRIHILPFIGESGLYTQFKLDEPWDSSHNMGLLDRMPDAYRIRGIDGNKTAFHVYVGENTPFGQDRSLKFRSISDGTSNTLMVVMGTPETAVEWTKPGGIEFDPAQPFRDLADVGGDFPVVMMDGSVRLLSKETSPQDMANLVDHRDGQRVNPVFVPWE